MITHDDIFLKIFEEKQQKSKTKLNNYIKKQGDEQTHDLRTSIRRLEATYLIIPKSYKTRKSDKFVKSYKKFFQLNSKIRDFDVIIDKFTKCGFTKDSKIIQYLRQQKQKNLKQTVKEAKKLSKIKIVKLESLDSGKILKKYEKKIIFLIDSIQHLMTIVISNESKIAELHSMRKLGKKLRYVFEIDPNNSYQHMIDNMKTFQNLLGSIHDCDICIDFIEKRSKKFPELKPVLIYQKNMRNKIYKQLKINLSDTKIG